MNRSIVRLTCGTAAMVLVPLAATATPAQAGNAIGGCTNSYQEYSYDDPTSAYPDILESTGDVIAEQIAPVVDGNHDYLICYKPYPNGQHNNGTGGNLVDNTSGPHS